MAVVHVYSHLLARCTRCGLTGGEANNTSGVGCPITDRAGVTRWASHQWKTVKRVVIG